MISNCDLLECYLNKRPKEQSMGAAGRLAHGSVGDESRRARPPSFADDGC